MAVLRKALIILAALAVVLPAAWSAQAGASSAAAQAQAGDAGECHSGGAAGAACAAACPAGAPCAIAGGFSQPGAVDPTRVAPQIIDVRAPRLARAPDTAPPKPLGV